MATHVMRCIHDEVDASRSAPADAPPEPAVATA
jgi:hypothetical protein